MFKKLPSDNFIEEMDPLEKAWMYYHWRHDYKDSQDMLENVGYLIGSFTNPEAVKQMLDSNSFSSTDEEFDELSKKILEENKSKENSQKSLHRRHRRRISQE